MAVTKGMKEKNLQLRLLYPARISFKYEEEIKSFTDKQKLREISTTKPTLQQMLKISRQETQKRSINSNPKQQSKWQQDHTSIITLNVNGLNAPTKRQRRAE